MQKLVKVGQYAINPDFVVSGYPAGDDEYVIRVVGDIHCFYGADVKEAREFIERLCKTPRENFNG